MALYPVDEYYSTMLDYAMRDILDGRDSRALAMSAWYFAKNGLFSYREFWYAVAGYQSLFLTDDERETIQNSLRGDEIHYLTNPPSSMPAVPEIIVITWQNFNTTATTTAQKIVRFKRAIQAFMDTKAKEKDFNSITDAATYVTDPNPKYRAWGEALVAWRSAVWTYAQEQLAVAMANQRPVPTVEAFLAELPAFDWPNTDVSE